MSKLDSKNQHKDLEIALDAILDGIRTTVLDYLTKIDRPEATSVLNELTGLAQSFNYRLKAHSEPSTLNLRDEVTRIRLISELANPQIDFDIPKLFSILNQILDKRLVKGLRARYLAAEFSMLPSQFSKARRGVNFGYFPLDNKPKLRNRIQQLLRSII